MLSSELITTIAHDISLGRSPNEKPAVAVPGEKLGEGDVQVIFDFLPSDIADIAFERLRTEVTWNVMYHRGGEVPRLVAVEGEVQEDGSFPIYRHPADQSPPLLPFSPTVARIRHQVQQVLNHPVNHVLIQHYRSGADYISEHSDKTIDIVRGSKIVNVSIGSQRVMTLRTKKDNLTDESGTLIGRRTQHIPLPHNSMFVMGLDTNARWLHSIRTDKRPKVEKTEAELAQGGERISLTFRYIGTFLNKDGTFIWGQGARGKTRDDARLVIHGGDDADKLIEAFGKENHQSDFDWDFYYGKGFDVLHFTVKDS